MIMEVFTKETVLQRLESFGYTVKGSDDFIISFSMDKVENTIKNDINAAEIPEGLEHAAVDMVVGEFLYAKKTFQPDDLEGFDLGYAVKQLSTGDTTTVFATGDGSETDEARLSAFINYLQNNGKSQFSSFRRIRW